MRSVHVCKPSVSNLLAPRRLLTPRIAVMLNDHSLYEHILEDDIFFGVVGMLECPSCRSLLVRPLTSPWFRRS